MQITTETITPEMAAEYLKHNTDNRSLRTGHIEYLANAMKRGEWVLSHQGIAFNEHGVLVDGQHRLHAVIKSGVTIDMVVSRGVGGDVYKVTDGHARRSYGDILHMSAGEVAALKLISDIRFGCRNHSTEQLLSVLGTELGRLSVHFGRNHNGAGRIVVRAGYVVAVAIRSMMDGTDYPQRLFNDIRLSNTESLPPAGHAFLKMMISGVVSTKQGYGGRCEDLARGLVLFDKARSQNKIVKAMDVEAAKNLVVKVLGI